MLGKIGRDIDKAVYISLPYEESINRISKRMACSVCRIHVVMGKDIVDKEDPCPACGGKVIQRGDDTPEGIAKRLKTFYEITVPVIEYYKDKGMLIEVDGLGSVEEVGAEIIKKLEK